MNIRIYSTVPSPYQRDFFLALAGMPEVELEVFYYEAAAPDSPWPAPALASFEQILTGGCLGRGRLRCHWHRKLPPQVPGQEVIINAALTDLTTQWLMRRHRQWWFWGELIRSGHDGLAARVRRALARPLAHAKGIFAVGRVAASDYAHRFNGVRVINLPYHCRLEEFFAIDREPVPAGSQLAQPSARTQQTPELTLLFCGQMIERKGIDILLGAFARAIENGLSLRLLLAGREDRIQERLADLPNASRHRIEVVGFVAPEDLPTLFRRADLMILPSRHDGWGVVINQAMAAGLPVIATSAVQAAAELVEPGGGGWLVAPGDAIALMGAIEDACRTQRSGLLHTMGRFNRNQARRITPEAGARLLYDSMRS